MNIRLVGDVHGKQDRYINLVKDCEFSIQLGDMGFNYDKLNVLDSNKHKFIGGNHDLYERDVNGNMIYSSLHSLNDFGIIPSKDGSNIPDMFYVRGGHSIDKAYRTEGKDWFQDEQLTYSQMCKAIELYERVKPEIVLSHETPASMIPYVANPNFANMNLKPSDTAKMLQVMYNIHQPKFWFFGHFHIDKTFRPNQTRFFCLDELSTIDIYDNDKGYTVDAKYVRFNSSDLETFV